MVNVAREKVVDYLVNEIWGPVLTPPSDGVVELPEPGSDGVYQIPGEGNTPRILDTTTGDLIVTGAAPKMIYGTGVLHAQEQWDSPEEKDATDSDEDDNPVEDPDAPDVVIENHTGGGGEDAQDSISLDQSQKRKPSALGFTCELILFEGDELSVKFEGATYEELKLKFDGRSTQGWRRKPFTLEGKLVWDSSGSQMNQLISVALEGDQSDLISAKIRFRNSAIAVDSGVGLVATLVVKNESKSPHEIDVFQSILELDLKGSGYVRSSKHADNSDAEQRELDHLYRHTSNYAVGHGTSVNWPQLAPGQVLRQLRTTSLPIFYQEVLDFEGAPTASMDALANASKAELRTHLSPIIIDFEKWILRSCADQSDDATFNRRKQCILLRR